MLEQADNQVVLATPVTVVAAALERPGGVSVSAAAAEAGITPSEVRSIIDGLRRKGAVITALGDGIFRGGGPGARPRSGRATPGTTVTKPTATSGRRTHTPRQLQIVWKGQELTFPTHIEALVEILKRLADQYDGALDKLRNVGGRVRPLIAPTSDQLYPGRTDLAETFSREFTRGWFVGTNYSHSDVRRLLRAAVESVGLGWDVEVYLK